MFPFSSLCAVPKEIPRAFAKPRPKLGAALRKARRKVFNEAFATNVLSSSEVFLDCFEAFCSGPNRQYIEKPFDQYAAYFF